MNRPSPAQVERAKRWLAREGAARSADDCATAAGRVYDKLDAHLSPLLGAAGVRALFVRSAKLSQDTFACFAEVAVVESSTKLRDCLQAQDPAVATESAAALFGTFLSLIILFIGERLTLQTLRSAWPTIEEMAPTENNQ